MNETQQTLATWWTQKGFIHAPEPEPYAAMPITGEDWHKRLKAIGYYLSIPYGGEFADLQLSVNYHKTDGHLLVCIDNSYGELAQFFVSRENNVEFFATWYVQFLMAAAVVNQKESISQIAKTLTAFVRMVTALKPSTNTVRLTWMTV